MAFKISVSVAGPVACHLLMGWSTMKYLTIKWDSQYRSSFTLSLHCPVLFNHRCLDLICWLTDYGDDYEVPESYTSQSRCYFQCSWGVYCWDLNTVSPSCFSTTWQAQCKGETETPCLLLVEAPVEDVASWYESEPQYMHTPVAGSLGARGFPVWMLGLVVAVTSTKEITHFCSLKERSRAGQGGAWKLGSLWGNHSIY